MEQWLNPAWWQGYAERLLEWWMGTIMVPATLIQLLLILVSIFIARRLAPRLRNLLALLKSRSGNVPAFATVLNALATVSIPLIWLVMQWLAVAVAREAQWPHPIVTTTSSLLTAWIVIRLASHWLDNPLLSRLFALTAWTIAALNTLGYLPEAKSWLDSFFFNAGTIRISALTVIQGVILLGVLLWLAVGFTGMIERRLKHSKAITPAAGVLIGKLVRIILIASALLYSLNSLGIDLTALAVFSGALAVGLGFGLQKIFSNLVSGLILLLDKSIKPGDVIALGQTYGWINQLGARYVSVITRDGVEHLIPNEELITQRVENWTHSDSFVRLRIPVGVSYKTDPRLAIKLCIEAAELVPRVLLDPAPKCLLRGFGDNSVDLELRIWVEDPENGRGNVISDVLLNTWDNFQEHGIEIPFPQRDLHIRSVVEQAELPPIAVRAEA